MMKPYLLVRSGSIVCAIPVHEVAETMRPLPTDSIAGMPAFVRGLSIIRGRPTAVLDLTSLLEGSALGIVTRYVTLQNSERPVALAVEEVIGIQEIETEGLMSMGPLVDESRSNLVRHIGTLDDRVLMVLRDARVIEGFIA